MTPYFGERQKFGAKPNLRPKSEARPILGPGQANEPRPGYARF